MKFNDLQPHHKKRLKTLMAVYLTVGFAILIFASMRLITERQDFVNRWPSYFQDEPEHEKLAQELSKDATVVTVGTYVENLREINLKSSNFRVEMLVWFNWKGDPDLNPAGHFRVYKGIINKSNVLKEITTADGEHYQLVRLDTTVSKNYDTRRFPLESHGLRVYIESDIPIQQLRYVADVDNSGINRSISITGYEFKRHGVGTVTYKYDSTHGDPELEGFEMSSEMVTGMEINRSGYGMYLKCFIALVGTLTWVFLALYLNTYHRIDPLSMIPAALFGTVTNIMVGANLLPDALEMGLLEYVNGWGVLTILAVAVAIININRVRTKYEDRDAARYMGQMIFKTLAILCAAGNIIFPLAAYMG